MEWKLQRYVGRTVEIMYIDQYDKITHRFIEIRSVNGSHVRAHCFVQGAPRIFKVENILAINPAQKWSV